MLNRRSLFGSGAALAALLSGKGAAAANTKVRAVDIEPRGSNGRMERLPRLDLESQQDFLTGFRRWVQTDLMPAARNQVAEILEENGHSVDDDVPIEEILRLAGDDPLVGTSIRAWLGGQQQIWGTLQEEFHNNSDAYLAELEAADQAGPGSVHLDPDLNIPNYARHEIHIQPGGYVGDPFAGYINHYGVNAFYAGRNYQDEVQGAMAAAMPTPADGRINRILDLGCATGRLTFAMKEKHPEAEVWGIDVGAPMVRYAHMRALDIGVECHFAQRLAEDTRFPDEHFDMVVSYIMFHEVTQEATQQIIAEAFRVLRPGGIFFPVDFRTGKQEGAPNAFMTFARWWDHRWNNEPWRPDFSSRDFGDSIAAVGFDVDETVESVRRGHGGILATKPV
jgi:SAM-dependent methyltransferase